MASYRLLILFCFDLYSGQVDSQLQVTGSILRPDVSGMIRLSHGEAQAEPLRSARHVGREQAAPTADDPVCQRLPQKIQFVEAEATCL